MCVVRGKRGGEFKWGKDLADKLKFPIMRNTL